MSTSRLLTLFIAIALLTVAGCSSDGDQSPTDGDVPVVDGDVDDNSIAPDGDTDGLPDGDADIVDSDADGDVNNTDGGDQEIDIDSDSVDSDSVDKDNEDDIELTDNDNEQDTEIVILTWTDAATKLMWQMDVTGLNMHFDTAKTHCENLELDGYSDWRLPNISELRTLIRDCANTEIGGACGAKDECSACGVSNADICLADSCWNDSCSGCVVNGGLANGCYWPSELGGICSWFWSSSVTTEYDHRSWAVAFAWGSITHSGKSEPYDARCVRNDNVADGDEDTETEIEDESVENQIHCESETNGVYTDSHSSEV